MTGHDALWPWLVHAAMLSGFVLLIGSMVLLMVRQPVYRLRLIQWVFVGCVAAPWLHGMAPWTTFSWGVLPSSVDDSVDTEKSLSLASSHLSASTSNENRRNAKKQKTIEEQTERVASEEQRRSNEATTSATSSGLATSRSFAGSNILEKTPDKAESPSVSGGSMTQFAVLLYLVAAAGMCGWLVVGMWRRFVLERRAKPASAEILDVFRQVAGKDVSHVRVIVSDRINGPVTWGIFRPVIVLPSSFAENPGSPAVRWCLAHEWSHIENRDVGAILLATAAQIVCFYQPLFWWIRRQLVLCQDFIADDRAARETDSAEDYAEFLVGLAQSRLTPAFSVSLGMGGGRSSLFHRVKRLIDPSVPLVRKCRLLPTLLIATSALAFLASLSTIRLDAAGAENAKTASKEKKEASTEKKQVTRANGVVAGHVVRADDGSPVAHAKIVLQGRRLFRATADAMGRFRFKNIPPYDYRIWAHKKNLASKKQSVRRLKVGGSD